MRKICGISRTSSSKNRKTINMKTAKDYQQEFRLKDDELAQFDEFLNDPKRTCFHGKEYLIYKDPDPEGSFIIVGVNFRILPAGTPIVTKNGSVI